MSSVLNRLAKVLVCPASSHGVGSLPSHTVVRRGDLAILIAMIGVVRKWREQGNYNPDNPFDRALGATLRAVTEASDE